MLEIVHGSNLTKVHHVGDQRVLALNAVSLEVYSGELVALVGRPRSGKSTLLNILGCLQRPDSGQVCIEGLEVTTLDDEELARVRTNKIGFVTQSPNLLRNETVLRNVEIPLRDQGLGAWDRREKAEEVLRAVGLENRLEHRPGRLSMKQRQCVAIARAMVHNPAVIFVDEPTMALDSTSREEMLGLFQKLNDQGRTIIVASPDPGVANYCSRVLRIAGGSIVDDSPVPKKRIISYSRMFATPPPSYAREVMVCPLCGIGNFKDQAFCRRCESPLHVGEEEEPVEGGLGGAQDYQSEVEDTSEEGETPTGDLRDELKEVPLFLGLGSETLDTLIPALEGTRFQKDSTIIKQGDDGDSFYIIRSGTVQVVLERDGGPAIKIAPLGPKETFGEMALLTDEARSASVVALSDVEAWRLPKAEFERLLSENPSFAIQVSRVLSKRLKTLQDRIVP